MPKEARNILYGLKTECKVYYTVGYSIGVARAVVIFVKPFGNLISHFQCHLPVTNTTEIYYHVECKETTMIRFVSAAVEFHSSSSILRITAFCTRYIALGKRQRFHTQLGVYIFPFDTHF